MKTDLPRPDLSNPVHLLAFGFGSGLVPKAPGTFGTAAALLLYLPLAQLPLPWYLLMVLTVSLAGIWLCGRSSELLGVHDHPGIVWDEFAGLFVTLIALPEGPGWLLAGFLLFRLFDIWKPWPIGWLDRQVSGGLGIMLDDLLAGLFAWLLLQGAALYILG